MEELVNKERTLPERLDAIEYLIKYGPNEKDKKSKRFRFPLKILLRQKRLARKSGCIIVVPEKNRGVDAHIGQIRDGMLWYKEYSKEIMPEHVYLWRGKTPIVFVPSWASAPITFDDVKDTSTAQDLIIKRVQYEIINAPKDEKRKKLTLGMAVAGVVILGLLIYVFAGGL